MNTMFKFLDDIANMNPFNFNKLDGFNIVTPDISPDTLKLMKAVLDVDVSISAICEYVSGLGENLDISYVDE